MCEVGTNECRCAQAGVETAIFHAAAAVVTPSPAAGSVQAAGRYACRCARQVGRCRRACVQAQVQR